MRKVTIYSSIQNNTRLNCARERKILSRIFGKNISIAKITLLACIVSGLAGCSSMSGSQGGTANLQQLQQITWQSTAGAQVVNINQIRLTALKETALSLGAQSALAWRANQLNNMLTQDTRALDFAYNFSGLLLGHDVLPPVLVEANNALNLADPDTIRIAEKIYKIQVQAHFVTVPPTWRDYLWMNFSQPSIPDSTLLPKNSQEKLVWQHYVTIGWQNGLNQATNIFDANMAKLNRDYKGMILYRKLYEENMVSAPYVATTNLGITGDTQQMSIGDKVLRITALPELNLQGQTWRPAIVPTDPYRPMYANPPASLLNPTSSNGSSTGSQNIWIK